MEKIRKLKNGFTTVELLVALSIFVIAIAAVIEIFLASIGGSKRIFGKQDIDDAGRYIMELMSKELRMSKIITADGWPYETLDIVNSKSEALNYKFDNINGNIMRDGSVLNSDDVAVTGNFYVLKSAFIQPRVTIQMHIKNKVTKEKLKSSADLQTTISSRRYAP